VAEVVLINTCVLSNCKEAVLPKSVNRHLVAVLDPIEEKGLETREKIDDTHGNPALYLPANNTGAAEKIHHSQHTIQFYK